MKPCIETRVGQIVDGDNRFLGRSMFDDWSRDLTSPGDALLAAAGVRDLSPVNRESLRLIALCSMTPDARVWPLKLTRLLACHGDPAAGYFGGQLVSTGKVMGPGAVTHAAKSLCWVGDAAGDAPTDAAAAAAIAAWRARSPGPLAGFGVPFRDQDERRVALLRFVRGGPIERRRYWRLHEQFVAAAAPLRPNCALSFAALMLDMGVRPEHCGLMLSATMAHVFFAHAIEGSTHDAVLRALPVEAVDYRGVAPRHSQGGAAPAGPPLAPGPRPPGPPDGP